MLSNLFESDVLLTAQSQHLGYSHMCVLRSVYDLGEFAFGERLCEMLCQRTGRFFSRHEFDKLTDLLIKSGLMSSGQWRRLTSDNKVAHKPFILTQAGHNLLPL